MDMGGNQHDIAGQTEWHVQRGMPPQPVVRLRGTEGDATEKQLRQGTHTIELSRANVTDTSCTLMCE